MRMDKGIVRVRRICKNTKLPVRGIARAAGCSLAAAQTIAVPDMGKC